VGLIYVGELSYQKFPVFGGKVKTNHMYHLSFEVSPSKYAMFSDQVLNDNQLSMIDNGIIFTLLKRRNLL